MIVVATILCDRKADSQLIGIKSAARLKGDITLYINVEVGINSELSLYKSGLYSPLMGFLEEYQESGKTYDLDVWSMASSWKEEPKFDQDQRRLDSICIARNMARNYAMRKEASHLLFVDSDVIVRPDGLERLLALNRPLCGGFVPGRGAHGHVHYIFGKQVLVPSKPGVIECDHGTMGYCLIRRDLLSTLAFRYGASRTNPRTGLSEDPAFAEDAVLNGFGRWWIDKQTVAEHWGELDATQVANDKGVPI